MKININNIDKFSSKEDKKLMNTKKFIKNKKNKNNL